MPRPGRRRQVDRSRWRQFSAVGEHFAQAAQLATEFQYWNAAGVLQVHAAIALTDALTIKAGGVKSAGEDHLLAADLLETVLVMDAEALELRSLSDSR